MATRSLSLTVIRPEDLLLLRLDFLDVDYTPAGGGAPARIGGQSQARLIVHFQPQHITEEAFWEVSPGATQTQQEIAAGQVTPIPTGDDPLPSPGSIQARIAGPTRLVFSVPAGTDFPLTIDGVLEALMSLPLRVPKVAAYEPSGCLLPVSWLRALGLNPPPPVSEPARDETAIEAPYRLLLSPDSLARWTHAPLPVEHDGRTELWHTILGTRRADSDPRVRAVWSPDYSADLPPHDQPPFPPFQPFRTSLDRRDRNELVKLTSDYYIRDEYTPKPVRTERLMLTTLGAWLDVDGRWEPPKLPGGGSLTVEQWRHVATMGRDHYVRVMYKGYLFPFGHRASLVKITERKFRRNPPDANGFIAYDLQRMFIIVREPVRTYTPRDMPLRSIEITRLVSPDLDKPENSQVDTLGQEAFWPRIFPKGGPVTDFRFSVAARDWENHLIEFTIPQIFVSVNIDTKPAELAKVFAAYAKESVTGARRTAPLGGQHVAFAPPKAAGKEDTTLAAASMSFDAAGVSGDPHCRPLMKQSDVDIPAVNNLIGKPIPSVIEWETTYTNPALSTEVGAAIGNAAQVFAKVVSGTKLEFPADKAGGMAAPDMAIKGLSRSLGPVNDVATMVGGVFEPKNVLPNVELMGGILLSAVIQQLKFDNASSTQKLPQLTSVREGNLLRTSYVWRLTKAELQASDLFKPGPAASLTLKSEVVKDLGSGAPPIFSTVGTLADFGVILLPAKDLTFATLNFESVTFTALPGKKLDTAVKLAGIEFEGILKFVNDLREFIPLDGFNDPPAIQLTPPPDVGVNVGFSLGIPSIGVGVMTMQNVSLSAGFFLPLSTPKPMTFRFAFCERQQPFILTVSLFGGGGFFAIDIGLDGVTKLEAALEFGASIALNLGVASGQATIMAGIYYQALVGKGFELTAYFRACGALSVLGIITVSVEFYLGMTFTSKHSGKPHEGTLWGQATLTVKIKIVFFSISVGISMERELAGSDPTFRELLSPSDWTHYCEAFDSDYPVLAGD